MRTISGIRRNVKNHGRCSIFVDGDFFAACPIDVALALGLKKGIEITDELERRLRSEDRRMVLRQKSYRFATYKPRTESQVRQHLEGLEATPEEIADVMAWLKDFRLVDDHAYVQRFIEASHERKPLSPAAVRRTLLQRGIDRFVIDDAVQASFTEEDTVELALIVAEKKRRMLKPGTPKDAEERIVRFLQYRGYTWPVIREVIARMFTPMLVTIVFLLSYAAISAQGILQCERWRLSRSINDYQPTTLPVIGPDGSLFLDRKLHPLNEGGTQDPDDVWIARWHGGREWGNPSRESFTVVRRPDVVFNFSADGLTALVVGHYRVEGTDTVPCFALLHRPSVMQPFDRAEVITIPDLPALGRNFFGCITDDRNTMVVSLERPGGTGDLDLYVTHRCGTSWSALASLGPDVNTVGIDGSPWLAPDGRTLFYATNGRDDRRGKSDLYVTRRNADSWTSWTRPVNLGTCINTIEDETTLSLVGRGDSALITSWDADAGRAGVYLAVIDPRHRPSPSLTFVHDVRDALTDSIIPNVVMHVTDSTRPKSCDRTYRIDRQRGEARCILAASERYGITTTAPGYVPHHQVINVQNLDSTMELRVTTKLFNGQRPLASVFFDRGSSIISSSQMDRLRTMITAYDVHQIRFEVAGYADALGTAPLNASLSQRRADAVRDALSALGLDPARIVASGKGIERITVNTQRPDEEHPESRRVDVYPAP